MSEKNIVKDKKPKFKLECPFCMSQMVKKPITTIAHNKQVQPAVCKFCGFTAFFAKKPLLVNVGGRIMEETAGFGSRRR